MMTNHDDRPMDPERAARVREMFAEMATPLGATGKHPLGKLTDTDQGEIRMAIGADSGRVLLDFGTPCRWVGMTPEQARDIARSILESAGKAQKQRDRR